MKKWSALLMSLMMSGPAFAQTVTPPTPVAPVLPAAPVVPAALAPSLPRLQDLAPALQASSHPRRSELERIYLAALKNLDTQFVPAKDGTVYVSTGDIKAEWLRDSSVQVRPYLFFAKDPAVASLIKNVVLRQARSMSRDPYANAFYESYKIHERKYELDSLVNPILLTWTYWKVTGDGTIVTKEVWDAFKLAMKTMRIEQDHEALSTYSHPHLSGAPVAKTGMIWQGFRPSDDRCQYNYNIPSNAMAVQALRAMSEMATEIMKDAAVATASADFAKEIFEAIKKYGVARTRDGEIVWAYEVDGRGNAIVMDDANLPSLMTLPYYGFSDVNDSFYQTTRNRILSPKNPYYFTGSLLSGIGSPHTPRDMVWPLGLLNQALTATTSADFELALGYLIDSDYGGAGLHESVHVNDASNFTRADFGWPNAMFVEMALNKWNGLPELPKPSAP